MAEIEPIVQQTKCLRYDENMINKTNKEDYE